MMTWFPDRYRKLEVKEDVCDECGSLFDRKELHLCGKNPFPQPDFTRYRFGLIARTQLSTTPDETSQWRWGPWPLETGSSIRWKSGHPGSYEVFEPVANGDSPERAQADFERVYPHLLDSKIFGRRDQISHTFLKVLNMKACGLIHGVLRTFDADDRARLYAPAYSDLSTRFQAASGVLGSMLAPGSALNEAQRVAFAISSCSDVAKQTWRRAREAALLFITWRSSPWLFAVTEEIYRTRHNNEDG